MIRKKRKQVIDVKNLPQGSWNHTPVRRTKRGRIPSGKLSPVMIWVLGAGAFFLLLLWNAISNYLG